MEAKPEKPDRKEEPSRRRRPSARFVRRVAGALASSIEAAVSDLDIAIDDDAPSGKRLGADDFGRSVREGNKIVHTRSSMPSSRVTTTRRAWSPARGGGQVPALVGLARGSMNEEQLVALCFQFYEKELIDLEQSKA